MRAFAFSEAAAFFSLLLGLDAALGVVVGVDVPLRLPFALTGRDPGVLVGVDAPLRLPFALPGRDPGGVGLAVALTGGVGLLRLPGSDPELGSDGN